MSDFAKAVEAMRHAPMCDACGMDVSHEMERPACYCDRVALECALPHLRRMHLAEAAQLLADHPDMEWMDAAQFLRALTDDPSPPTV